MISETRHEVPNPSDDDLNEAAVDLAAGIGTVEEFVADLNQLLEDCREELEDLRGALGNADPRRRQALHWCACDMAASLRKALAGEDW